LDDFVLNIKPENLSAANAAIGFCHKISRDKKISN